jgi:23S rRNA G2069 N7-methylase RlmK/C1962 C5-methylase RlmI
LNDWDPERFPLIREDFFVFAKRARNWDPAKKFSGIILDPPSFSRGKSGTFSTERDWSKLHALAGTLFDRSAERLWISSSLNTRALSPKQVLVEMKEGLKQADLTVVEIVFEIHPEKREFPASKHLKGFVALLKPGSA